MEERLSKFIASCGVASRREAEKLILMGLIKVNGKLVKELGTKVTEDDKVEYQGKLLAKPSEVKLWQFYKPRGCVCTKSDEMNRKTIYDFLPPEMQNIHYIGRLDLNSEGLLLLTNNAALKQAYESPNNGMLRTYTARVFGHIPEGFFGDFSKEGLEAIEPKSGTYRTYKIKIAPVKISNDSNIHVVKFILEEGKNREIRNVCAHFDLKVARLKRVAFGKYNLGEAEAGDLQQIKI